MPKAQRGTPVHLRSFLLGSLAATIAATIAGVATGMSWPWVLGLGLSVWVAAQGLYVVLIACLARKEERAPDAEGCEDAHKRDARPGGRGASARDPVEDP
jgi:hypothetical protein